MQLRIFAQRHFGTRQLIAPFAIAAALALTACGGSSSKATGTAASSSTIQAATTTATQSAGVATAVVTGGATATATTAAATATTTAAATATKTAAATSTATTAAAAASSTGVPLSASSPLDDVTKAWTDLKSYKMTITVYDNGSATASVTGTVETINPDKSHTVVEISGQKIETITIGDKTYINIGGTWQQTPGGMPDQMPSISGGDIFSQLATPDASISNTVTSKGTETLNGVKYDVYEVKTSDTNTSTFWVGEKDHLPYKITSRMDTSNSVIIFSDFNASFDIKAPI